jgi:hypothetical protein
VPDFASLPGRLRRTTPAQAHVNRSGALKLSESMQDSGTSKDLVKSGSSTGAKRLGKPHATGL